MNYSNNKGFRLLSIYERLLKGTALEKQQLADEFEVSAKTVQRDIDDLRAFLAESDYAANDSIKYDKKSNTYVLKKLEREWLTSDEVLAVAKILLDSRPFCKSEMTVIIEKLLLQVLPEKRKKISALLNSELRNYISPQHGQMLIEKIGILTDAVNHEKIAEFLYKKQDLSVSRRTVKPVAITFSEHYYYLMAVDCNDTKDYPKSFRIDRIDSPVITSESFHINYSRHYSEGEYKNKIQFMYPGKLFTVRFRFSGDSLEAVLDRLPTARIVEQNDDYATVEAQIYEEGVMRWLLSQKDGVEVISPTWYRDEIAKTIEKMAKKY